jgi:hypothetical protein
LILQTYSHVRPEHSTEKRKQMKRLTLLVTALLACAITAQAKINETRNQLIKRFGRNQIIKQTANSVAFKKGNNVVTATLRNGVCVFESYSMTTEFNAKDAEEIIKTVLGTKTMPEFDKIGAGLVSGVWEVLLMKGHVYERTGWSIVVGYREFIDQVLANPDKRPAPRMPKG